MGRNSSYLKWIIIVLVLLNISTLTFVWLNKTSTNHPNHHPPHPPKHGKRMDVRGYLEKEIGFNKEQLKQFDISRDKHRKALHTGHDKIRDTKHILLSTLEPNDSLFNIMGSAQIEIEKAILIHFKEIKEICNEEQKPLIDDVFVKITRMMAPGGPGKRH